LPIQKWTPHGHDHLDLDLLEMNDDSAEKSEFDCHDMLISSRSTNILWFFFSVGLDPTIDFVAGTAAGERARPLRETITA
jgi:hypothetical protein